MGFPELEEVMKPTAEGVGVTGGIVAFLLIFLRLLGVVGGGICSSFSPLLEFELDWGASWATAAVATSSVPGSSFRLRFLVAGALFLICTAACSAAFPFGNSGAGFTCTRAERRRDMVKVRDGADFVMF